MRGARHPSRDAPPPPRLSTQSDGTFQGGRARRPTVYSRCSRAQWYESEGSMFHVHALNRVPCSMFTRSIGFHVPCSMFTRSMVRERGFHAACESNAQSCCRAAPR
eukprot:363813-Chlamydomonas_euryale.AAC.5